MGRFFRTRVGNDGIIRVRELLALTHFTCAEGAAIIQSWNESGWKAHENLRC